MEFAIMAWKSPYGATSSIYGVIDSAKPGQLPSLGKGYWAEFRHVSEDRFPHAPAARQAIEAQGFYLYGTEVGFTEKEGRN